MRFTQRQDQQEVATLDMDATLVETQKERNSFTGIGSDAGRVKRLMGL